MQRCVAGAWTGRASTPFGRPLLYRLIRLFVLPPPEQLMRNSSWAHAYAFATTKLLLGAVERTRARNYTALTSDTVLDTLRSPESSPLIGPIAFPQKSTTNTIAAFSAIYLTTTLQARRMAALTDIGFVSITPCPPGRYGDGVQCLWCGKDTFKPDAGNAESCTPCPTLGNGQSMTTGMQKGATSQSDCLCPIGTIQLPVSARVGGPSGEITCHPPQCQSSIQPIGGSRIYICASLRLPRFHPHSHNKMDCGSCRVARVPDDALSRALPGVKCPIGASCNSAGLMPASLVVDDNFWRGHPEALAITRCSTDTCRSGLVNRTSPRSGWLFYSTPCADGYTVS